MCPRKQSILKIKLKNHLKILKILKSLKSQEILKINLVPLTMLTDLQKVATGNTQTRGGLVCLNTSAHGAKLIVMSKKSTRKSAASINPNSNQPLSFLPRILLLSHGTPCHSQV